MSDIKDINSLESEFKEMKDYSDAQFTTIVKLQEKVSKLESENNNLKSMLEGNIQSLNLHVSDLGIGVSNEQLICEVQLALLKERAINQELTLEEARKMQIYTTLLLEIKETGGSSDVRAEKMSNDELLKLVSNNEPTAAT